MMSKYERILPFAAVHNFGDDGVTVETSALLERRGQNSQYVRALHHPVAIIGSRVFTTAGRTIGKIEDYLFSSEDGKITGLEIAPDGFFKERSLVKGEHLIAVSGNTAMIKDEAIEDAIAIENPFISNIGAMADNMREKAGEFISNTTDFTKRISTNINERIDKIRKREEDFLNEYDEDEEQPEEGVNEYLDFPPADNIDNFDNGPTAAELVSMAPRADDTVEETGPEKSTGVNGADAESGENKQK